MSESEGSAVQRTVYRAWTHPPDTDEHQLTHAVDGGSDVAMCGAAITVRGAVWPVDPAG